MTTSKVRRFTILGLLALPAIAIAVAMIAVTWGHSTPQSQAADPDAMEFRVKAGSGDCAPAAKLTKCSVAAGSVFSLGVSVNKDFGGYTGIQTQINYGSLIYKPQTADAEIVWPDSGGINSRDPVAPTGAEGTVGHGDLSTGFGGTVSTHIGNIVIININCTAGPSSNAILLVPFDATTNPLGSAISTAGGPVPGADAIDINCVTAPTNTPTNTPQNTATPTNTPTQVPIPRMQKCNVADAVSTSCGTLSNVFLTRQGTKIPPSRCVDGTNGATLVERIHIPISGVDPKDPTQPRQIGGFSFQVKYDPLKVCVDLNPGPSWTANPQQICTVEDSISKPTLQGIARINCVTLGKATVVDTTDPVARILASITVRPQPEAYSQIKANQDNGQAVQLNDEACKLTDLQGHAIEVFSCEDADVTLRFLEGDVEPDCQVNTLDTQSIAFRWGAHKGQTLIYNDRFNLEPSGTQKDQDIDVNDLQFVYGRFGSTCASPWPAQVPVNPKA